MNAEPWPTVLAKAQRVNQLLRKMRPASPVELPTAHFYVLGMFWRSVRLFDGILLLVKAELPEEAAILCRSLFEDGLRLEQLAREPRLREARIVWWANAAVYDRRELLGEMHRLGLDNDIGAELVALDEKLKDVQGYATRHGVVRFEKFLETKAAAKKLGRDRDDVWFYELANKLVHGSDVAWLFAQTVSEGVARLHAKTANPKVRAGVVGFAVTSITKAAEAVTEMFQWPMPPELRQINQEIEALLTEPPPSQTVE